MKLPTKNKNETNYVHGKELMGPRKFRDRPHEEHIIINILSKSENI